jgi:hypothetical protein
VVWIRPGGTQSRELGVGTLEVALDPRHPGMRLYEVGARVCDVSMHVRDVSMQAWDVSVQICKVDIWICDSSASIQGPGVRA